MTETDEPLYAAAVGTRNTGYYMTYFRRCSSRGYAPMSWNWPAFFFGVIWLLYRRMYGWAGIALLMNISINAAAGIAFAAEQPLWVISAIQLVGLAGLALYFALHGNGMYYRWCGSLIDRARSMLPGQQEEQSALIGRFGGPNRPLMLGIIVMLVISMSLSGPLQQISQQAAQ